MNSARTIVAFGSTLIAAAFASVWRAPVAGSDLAVAVGQRADSHLLTARLAATILHSSLRTHIVEINICATAALACVVVVALIRGASRDMVAAGALLGAAAIALSPFSAALVVDPIGFEYALTLLVFTIVAADAARLIDAGLFVRIVACLALTLQDLAMLPAACVIGLASYTFRRRQSAALAPLAAALLGAVAHVMAIGWRDYLPQNTAIARVCVIGAAVLFVLVPFVLWLRNSVFEPHGILLGTPRATGWFVAIAMLGASAFSPNGDPSPYLLGAGIAVLFAIAQILSGATTWLRPSGAALVILVIFAGAFLFGGRFSTAKAAAEAVRSVDIAGGHGARSCVLASPKIISELTVNGALQQFYPQLKNVIFAAEVRDCAPFGTAPEHLLAQRDGRFVDFGRAGFELELAADSFTAPARPLPATYVITPDTRTHMPGGRGAFRDMLVAPNGKIPEMVIAAPFDVTFPCAYGGAAQTLSFAIANPLGQDPATQPVRLTVTAAGTLVADILIAPNHRDRAVSWRYASVRLPRRSASGCTSLRLSVRPAAGRNIGTWVALAAAALTPAKNKIPAKQIIDWKKHRNANLAGQHR